MKRNGNLILLTACFFCCLSACQKAFREKDPASVLLSKENQDNLALMEDSLVSGYINDDFSKMDTLNWNAPAGRLENGKMAATMWLQNATVPYYRGDFSRKNGLTINKDNYPVIAIKMRKPPKSNFFFDTNLGSYNNRNNNHTVIKQPDGSNIYYWDLRNGGLGTNPVPGGDVFLWRFQFKLAEVELTQAQLAAGDIGYTVSWIKSFRSVEDMRAKLNIPPPTPYSFDKQFKHPGLLHSKADLNRIRSLVLDQKPQAYACYQLLQNDYHSHSDYLLRGPFTYFTRDNNVYVDGVRGGSVKALVERDVLGAYYNALMWYITGDTLHARKSVQILDAYANKAVGIVGGDAQLNGLYGFLLANAGEIMRYTYDKWPETSAIQLGKMLQTAFYPTLRNFSPASHGNWDIICMKALMAIAVYTDDAAMVNKVVTYFYHGEGNGSIDQYIVSDAGQLQESNRDQAHSMLALGSLAELCEIAEHQGIPLYAASANAIMRGYEYTAAYNLGNTVSFRTWYDYHERNYKDYTPEHISDNARGSFRAVFEMAYNHYVTQKGLSMPYTEQVLQHIRPEGAPAWADNPGYGTLLFNRWE
ncbi:DUF4979 domain-containing protein [Niabella soli]|uniref:Alginate lyase domain-containing protein n=1 Tax=Niabella soli DSM 19437 TaxID=929713 RepID=W0F576_9BACT|nr:DUF4979 domain-containing protein [Niabella soli]AHF16958.1 hypothetical protein NIASO_20795 [Niabella soli DSM 19437]